MFHSFIWNTLLALHNWINSLFTKRCHRGRHHHCLLGTLRKIRRKQQRERHENKGLMRKTIALHVRFNSWYISLPSSLNQQREMTSFEVFFFDNGTY